MVLPLSQRDLQEKKQNTQTAVSAVYSISLLRPFFYIHVLLRVTDALLCLSFQFIYTVVYIFIRAAAFFPLLTVNYIYCFTNKTGGKETFTSRQIYLLQACTSTVDFNWIAS